MSCAGRGICGCGRESCIDAQWWAAWRRLWRAIGRAEGERTRWDTDIDVDYYRELGAL